MRIKMLTRDPLPILGYTMAHDIAALSTWGRGALADRCRARATKRVDKSSKNANLRFKTKEAQ